MSELGSPSLYYEALTPTAFLDRAGVVFGDRLAVVDGTERFSYRDLWERSRRLAGGLAAVGAAGRRVAVLAPNSHVMLEAHYGVPYAGAVLVALNTRLSVSELAYIVDHSGAVVFIYDSEFRDLAVRVNELVDRRIYLLESGPAKGTYEALLDDATPYTLPVQDELSLLSINYTSGTMGRPKGVMYHHRGAYLQTLAMAPHAHLDARSVFLWTLPMFHCNGWCFTWAVTAVGGVHIGLRKLDTTAIWRLLREEGVTHFNAAPTVLTSLAYDPRAEEHRLERAVRVCTGGAPPLATLLARMAILGMTVTHLYGLTETFGPALICDWWPEWDELSEQEQARIKARQGVGNVISIPPRVLDADGFDVPADGMTLGEIALRGNNLMLGYFGDPDATSQAAPAGWFRTGDRGVLHTDGYIELKDRAKDIIISGGENITSVEVEQAIASHPAVLEAAVLAVPDDTWGEVPAAYVQLKDGEIASEQELIDHVRSQIAHFKAPKRVVFGPLPKTSTGKVQKYRLRDSAWAGQDRITVSGRDQP